MPERTSYDPGTPSWVDLTSPDVDAAKRFYGELFGWTAEDAGPPEETGGYGFFMHEGRRVAGVGPPQGEGQPPAWTVFVSTDDADGVAERAREAGAQLLVEPMDVMDAGRMVMIAHPAAGMLGAWQPGQHTGAQLVNEPGGFSWNELHTRDLGGARGFGESVFGWEPRDQDVGEAAYTVFYVGEAPVAGMMAMSEGVPEEMPSYWLTYFTVENCDAAVDKAKELGGAITMEPMQMEGIGRFAIVADPQGANFGVISDLPS